MRGSKTNGQAIKRKRAVMRLTQEEVAAIANCDVKTFRKAEQGGRIDIAVLRRIAIALDSSPDAFSSAWVREPNDDVVHPAVADWFAAFADRQARDVARAYHHDAVLRLPGTPLLRGTGVFSGKHDFVQQANTTFELFELEPNFHRKCTLATCNNRVFADSGPVLLKCRANGNQLVSNSVHVFTCRGGGIVEHLVYFDVLALDRLVRGQQIDPAEDPR